MVSANTSTTFLPATTSALPRLRRRVRFALQCAADWPLDLDTMDDICVALTNTLRELDEIEPAGAGEPEPPGGSELVTVYSDHCAICGERGRLPLAVDRCRQTGEVRGLLCRRCHAAVEYLDGDLLKAQRLADYLRQGLREEAH